MAKNDAKNLVYGEWWRGQSGLGKLDQFRFDSLVNCDIHKEPGLIMPQLALVSDSNTPNEACFSDIAPSGDVYLVSKTSGKIWKKAIADGTYSLVHTNTNTSHRGCRYFNGYFWFWTASKLGYFDLNATWSDSFGTFTNGNARGSEEHANGMYISDGKYVARVDAANSFSANEFTIPAQFIATDLKSIGDDLLIGTFIGANIAYCKVFLWNTVDTTWTFEAEVFEIGINLFIQLDGVVLAQCGTEGRFYYWSGLRLKYFGKIRGITTTLGEQMSCVLNRRALFANANKIFSIHKEDKDFDWAFCCEYTVTEGTVASLLVQGLQMIVHRGTGVDKISTTNYAVATIDTPEKQTPFDNVVVVYDTYPEGVGIEVKINNADDFDDENITENINTKKRIIDFDGGLNECVCGQAKITLTPGTEGSPATVVIPKIKSILLI